MNKNLAINGGRKFINIKFKKFNNIDSKEINSVTRVLKTGLLSGFTAGTGKNFFGGKEIKRLEKKWSDFYNVKYSIAVNSWTSGLTVAMGSINLEPGDEVIVSPWTMSASVMSILHWNAIPIFVDIDENTFCIDPKKIEDKITKRTKAIISVDIFGISADISSLKLIAKKYNLKIISDSAQSPLAKYKNKLAGTLTDIGGYSFNCHKHIQCGEGGMLVTNNKKFADRMKLIRNHAEASIIKENDLVNMIGHNYRLGELEAAIMIEQLKKLKKIVKSRQDSAKVLIETLKGLKGLKLPKVPSEQTHSFYVFPMIIDTKIIKIRKEKIYKALIAEGVPGLMQKYINVHLYPIFQKQIAYGSKNFPWSINNIKYNYKKGICPVAENLNDNSFLGVEMCKYNFSKKETLIIAKAFKKVWKNLYEL